MEKVSFGQDVSAATLPISLLVGEMGGSPEGGAVPPTAPRFALCDEGISEGLRSTLLPSALPGISPTRGEIGSVDGAHVTILAESAADAPAREALLDRAMGPGRKRKSSEKLRRGRKPSERLAFVARDGDGRLVGTVRLWDVAFARGPSLLEGEMGGSPEGVISEGTANMSCHAAPTLPGRLAAALLLGPLAVDPSVKSAGIGSALMRHAIAEARRLGHRAILLVGDPEYYARFGFSSDKTASLAMPGPYERHRFLALEFEDGALDGAAGVLRAAGRKLTAVPTSLAA